MPKKPDVPTTKKAVTGTSPSGKPNVPACRKWKIGKCTRGDKCNYYHVPICRFYPDCRRGEACEFAHHDKATSTSTSTKKKGALAITDGSLAGLAMILPSDNYPLACMAGGDPCANTNEKVAKGDLRTRARFSKRAQAKATKHQYRNTMQPCGQTKPASPEKKNTEEIKLILAREKQARKRAWHLAKGLNDSMGTFDDTDASFFKILDPEKNSSAEPPPTAAYAARRSFVIDSGASQHLIGFDKLTPKEKGSIRSIAEPQRLQSANGIVTVDKEVHIFVPALNMSVWAQLMDDCPAILSMGNLCSQQGWTYEWKNGQSPTLSKGTRRITLTPFHDVPMVFAARQEQGVTPCEEEVRPAGSSTDVCPREGRSSTTEEAGHVSDIVGEGRPLQAGEGRPCASADGDGPDPAIRSQRKSTQRQKQRIVKSRFSVPASARHNQFTHFPLDMHCEICKLVKSTRSACKSGTVPEPDGLPPADRFGDRLTADHKTLADDQSARGGERYALIIQDEYSKWIQAYATRTRSHEEVVMAFRRFMPLNSKPTHVYVDNAPELLKALEELNWNHDTSTPHRPETNGVAERAVRRVKEGTSATLLQSGLTEEWWQEAMDCYCFLRCVHDKVQGDQTAFEKRFTKPFKGPIIPFGAQIEYKPC